MIKTLTFAAAIAALAVTSSAGAQQRPQQQQQRAERPYQLGPFWSVSMIDVEDGQFENYMEFLSGQWRSNQAFARQQGWILDYHILANDDRRPGEADLFLITSYRDFPSAAEIERRDAIMLRRMQTDYRAAEQQSGARVVMRKQLGSMLLRELTFRR